MSFPWLVIKLFRRLHKFVARTITRITCIRLVSEDSPPSEHLGEYLYCCFKMSRRYPRRAATVPCLYKVYEISPTIVKDFLNKHHPRTSQNHFDFIIAISSLSFINTPAPKLDKTAPEQLVKHHKFSRLIYPQSYKSKGNYGHEMWTAWSELGIQSLVRWLK